MAVSTPGSNLAAGRCCCLAWLCFYSDCFNRRFVGGENPTERLANKNHAGKIKKCPNAPLKQLNGGVSMIESELISGLSVDELEALADGLLTPPVQVRLSELLARSKEGRLSAADNLELDGLLRKADQITILKTRARYTLNQMKAEATGA